MKQDIEKLWAISQKETRTIIGLMSGTSLDGLDIALCEITGAGPGCCVELQNFTTKIYPEELKNQIREVFSRHDADLEKVTLMNALIGALHGQMVLDSLADWGISAVKTDAIASHGQTIYHAPASLHRIKNMPNATLQIGDGDHLAVKTGIITLSDFRQKHIASGGEGAPLAVYGDYLIFSERDENRIMLNIGGIANFTFLPGDLDSSRVFSTDVGPGNTMMDALMHKNFGRAYDADAAVAKRGTVNEDLLRCLFYHPFFGWGFPKTTGPELFNQAYLDKAVSEAGVHGLSTEDTMATLNRFSAEGIVRAIKTCFSADEKFTVYASGGGMHNPLLMGYIQNQLPDVTIRNTHELGILPDAKEAVLFAVLANEQLAGDVVSFGDRSGIPAVTMGKISFP